MVYTTRKPYNNTKCNTRQCIESNAYNTMHKIPCIQYNALKCNPIPQNPMQTTNKNPMHTLQCIKYIAYNALQCNTIPRNTSQYIQQDYIVYHRMHCNAEQYHAYCKRKTNGDVCFRNCRIPIQRPFLRPRLYYGAI